MEATLIHTNRDGQPVLDLRIYDDVLVHIFIVRGKDASYTITKHRGELVALGAAEVVDLQSIEEHITSLTIRTSAYDFEVEPAPDSTYRAYKKLLPCCRPSVITLDRPAKGPLGTSQASLS